MHMVAAPQIRQMTRGEEQPKKMQPVQQPEPRESRTGHMQTYEMVPIQARDYVEVS